MLEIFASSLSFFVLLFLFSIGAIGSLVLRKNDWMANGWSSLFAISGSIWGLLLSISIFIMGSGKSISLGRFSYPLLNISFNIDLLSVFFIFLISLITLFCSIYGIGYVRHYYKKYNLGVLGFFYNLFILGMYLVVTASNGLLFLIAWEVMALASYFLVIYDSNDQENIKAGFLYLVMTHIGTVFITISFLMLYKFTGSFDFEAIKIGLPFVPLYAKNIVFILAVLGFGMKAGIIPLHVWLPKAHPAAPSHVSGLMSGVMIKTGIYMMIRMFMDILQPIPEWWGFTLMIIGSVTALLGVLYALAENDIKRLLAYSSIENVGIILLGLGSSLSFYSLGMHSLALLGLVAALFHTLNHAIFKSLLFLGAGSVISETHTRNMENYGGLIKYMPQTALFFLVGSMAISSLPPLNGFFSEWMTFQAIFQGIATLGISTRWVFIIAGSSLAFTGGLALACFVKAFGTIFLARPRSSEVNHARESSIYLKMSMGSLAILSLLFGLLSGFVSASIEKVGRGLSIFNEVSSFVSVSPFGNISAGNLPSISGPLMFGSLVVIILGVLFATKYFVYGEQKIKIGNTWDCGIDLTPRMEITSAGFAHSIITIFKGVLKPSLQHDVEYHDADIRYLPETRTVTLSVRDVYHQYLYRPLNILVEVLSKKAKKIQSGNINAYILYIFIALLVALYFV